MMALSSCSTYVTPGGAANLQAISTPSVKKSYSAKPAATYPARIAVVRVQQNGYRSQTDKGHGSGRYSILTSSELESEKHLKQINQLPRVAGVVRIAPLLLPSKLESVEEIRSAAAQLRTDFIILYTLDTEVKRGDLFVPLSVVSLGLSPTQTHEIQSTASALLVDTRTGYLYGSIEEKSTKKGLATGWGQHYAIDQDRIDTEQEAFDEMVDSFEGLWKRATY